MEELNRLTISEYASAQKLPLIIVLDNIRSQHNVGSVFRTADAFRISGIVLCGITATPPNKEIQKAALGSTDSVTWKYVESTAACLKELKEDGYFITGLEQTHGSTDVRDSRVFGNPGKHALVIGNEVFGLSDEAIHWCDQVAEIPQYGTKHSLNVSVCTGIMIWEFYRRRGAEAGLI